MEFTTIYRNGKPQYFFFFFYEQAEFNFLRWCLLVTSVDIPRFGRILEMECLFSGSVWEGRQSHGYGYSCSADVYGTLIDAINKLYRKDLSDESKRELNVINTHEDTLKLSENLLKELAKLNMNALERKYSK